jgi:hypothetical protein
MAQLFFFVGYLFISITFPVLYHHLHTKVQDNIAIVIKQIICLGYLLFGMKRVHKQSEYPVQFVQIGLADQRRLPRIMFQVFSPNNL